MAINCVVRFFEEHMQMTVSGTKSGVIANIPSLADLVASSVPNDKVKPLNISKGQYGKMLGVATKAGIGRCVKLLTKRRQQFTTKTRRIRALGKIGISKTALLRATAMPAMYGLWLRSGRFL